MKSAAMSSLPLVLLLLTAVVWCQDAAENVTATGYPQTNSTGMVVNVTIATVPVNFTEEAVAANVTTLPAESADSTVGRVERRRKRWWPFGQRRDRHRSYADMSRYEFGGRL